ncbi:MAG: LLM class flavin-dependent oxidoreductase, partial [Actinobacteria bacterium]|nr:LLM class flavin-dependent oxidoreductase [Actinomycetota bacterium]
MEFGYFAQAFVPEFEMEAEPGAEHRRLMENLEFAVECDRQGVKYIWCPEHHFLYEYSHMPAPEVFLSFVGARTSNIHLGTAITNTTPPVNHPARIAERAAMLDQLSEGRFEFGTGRGSSTTEVLGFGIPDLDITKDMWDETIREFPKMWKQPSYSFEGKYFSMPPRNVLPKPYTQPHPPMWVACGSPATFEKAGSLGLGAFCFTTGAPETIAPLIKAYKDAVAHATPVGDYVNDNIL